MTFAFVIVLYSWQHVRHIHVFLLPSNSGEGKVHELLDAEPAFAVTRGTLLPLFSPSYGSSLTMNAESS